MSSSSAHENFAREILANIEKRRAASGKPAPEKSSTQAVPTTAVVQKKKRAASDVERRMRAALTKLQNLG